MFLHFCSKFSGETGWCQDVVLHHSPSYFMMQCVSLNMETTVSAKMSSGEALPLSPFTLSFEVTDKRGYTQIFPWCCCSEPKSPCFHRKPLLLNCVSPTPHMEISGFLTVHLLLPFEVSRDCWSSYLNEKSTWWFAFS